MLLIGPFLDIGERPVERRGDQVLKPSTAVDVVAAAELSRNAVDPALEPAEGDADEFVDLCGHEQLAIALRYLHLE